MQGLDLVGRTFNYLTVKELVGTNKHKSKIWKCECVCGNFRELVTGRLTRGITKSCGCKISHHHTEIEKLQLKIPPLIVYGTGIYKLRSVKTGSGN